MGTVCRHRDDRAVERQAAHRAEELGIPEGEDPAVGCHQPVALTVRCRRHRHDRLIEMDVPRRTEEPGVAEGEEPPIGRHLPIPSPTWGRGEADNALSQRLAAHGAVEGRITEGEQTTVRRNLPVPAAAGCRRHPDHRQCERLAAHRAEEPGIPEGEDPAVSRPVPVAPSIGRRRHGDDGRVQVARRSGRQPSVELRVLMEHRPRPESEPVPRRARHHVVLHDPFVGRAVAGDRDPDRAARVHGDHRGVLEGDRPCPQDRHQLRGLAIEDLESRRGRNEHVVVTRSGQIGERDAADDAPRRRHGPPGECGTGCTVERPDPSARPGVHPFDHLLAAVSEDVTDSGAAHGVAAQIDPPCDVAVGVRGEQHVRIRCSWPIGPGAERDSHGTAPEKVAHGRR